MDKEFRMSILRDFVMLALLGFSLYYTVQNEQLIKAHEIEAGKLLNTARSNTSVYNTMVDVLKKDGFEAQIVTNEATRQPEVIVTKVSK